MTSPAAQCLGPLLRYIEHPYFTKVQEGVIPSLFGNDQNCLVAAPTGSGKTVLLEVAMLRLFRHVFLSSSNSSAHLNPGEGSAHPPHAGRCKAVYICPIKALAQEKYAHWQTQFPALSVVIETGDQIQQRRLCATGDGESSAVGDALHSAAVEGMSSVSEADILVTTPERWDSITRRWKEKEVMAIVNSVGLLLLDEVHTVQEERGAAMEAIVSRMKAIQAAALRDAGQRAWTRIVAISGTLPNIRDMAEWLEVQPAMAFAFSPEDRPVPLTVRVVSYAHDSANVFAFHRFLAFKMFSLIQQHSEGKPTLVFCPSRKEASTTAARLVEDLREAATRHGQLTQLQPSDDARQLAQQASDKQLRGCLLTGVGFHHAAMTGTDRQLVERMFRERYIVVVCSTTTLALGVNLPAHLVVVKGTTFFAQGHCQDLPVSEVMQMCGRAGRPGLDDHGVALILTTQRQAHLYESLRHGTVAMSCVESHLHRRMIEHVNAEVTLRTIHSFASAMDWVKTTYFWIRLRKCPRHYGLDFTNKAEEEEFNAESFVEALIERVLRVLMEEGCVTMTIPSRERECAGAGVVHTDVAFGQRDTSVSALSQNSSDDLRQDGAVFLPSRLGRAMSRMYILFDTICALNGGLKHRGVARGTISNRDIVVATGEKPEDDERDADEAAEEDVSCTVEDSAGKEQSITAFTLQETLQLLCQCQELVEVRLRQGDRGPLNELNRALRYSLRSGRRGGREVREDWQKVYVLVQAHIGLLPITEVSLRNDSQRLWSAVPRVARFLEEYAWAHTTSYSLACGANVLARCVERRVWPDGLVLRQLQHVSDAVAKALQRGGYRDFGSLRGIDARQLEVLCSRLPPFGNQVLAQVYALPRVEVELTVDSARGGGSVCLHLLSFRENESAEETPDADDSNSAGVRQPAEKDRGRRGQTSRVGMIDTALRDGRLLLLVGATAVDSVLLKRFVSLSELQHGAGERHGVSFTFTLPPSAFRQGPLHLHGKIEARCLVMHMVGLDAVASVLLEETKAPPICGMQANTVHIASSSMSPAAKSTQTLDGFVSTATKCSAPVGAAVYRTEPGSNTSTSETVARIAAEAKESFDALMSDMAYVSSSEAARGARSQAASRHKRKRSVEGERGTPAPSMPSNEQVDHSPQRKEVQEESSDAAIVPDTVDVPAATARSAQEPVAMAKAAAVVKHSMALHDPAENLACLREPAPFATPPVVKYTSISPTADNLQMSSADAFSLRSVPAEEECRGYIQIPQCPSPPATRPLSRGTASAGSFYPRRASPAATVAVSFVGANAAVADMPRGTHRQQHDQPMFYHEPMRHHREPVYTPHTYAPGAAPHSRFSFYGRYADDECVPQHLSVPQTGPREDYDPMFLRAGCAYGGDYTAHNSPLSPYSAAPVIGIRGAGTAAYDAAPHPWSYGSFASPPLDGYQGYAAPQTVYAASPRFPSQGESALPSSAPQRHPRAPASPPYPAPTMEQSYLVWSPSAAAHLPPWSHALPGPSGYPPVEQCVRSRMPSAARTPVDGVYASGARFVRRQPDRLPPAHHPMLYSEPSWAHQVSCGTNSSSYNRQSPPTFSSMPFPAVVEAHAFAGKLRHGGTPRRSLPHGSGGGGGGAAAYTPHERRSSMVSQSWWQ